MRRVALVLLTTVSWLGSLDDARAQSRMGGHCAGGSAGSSSSLMMNSSPGFSAFNTNGSTLSTGSPFGAGTSSLMGGGFGSNLNFAAANGMAGGFNNGYGMGTMYGQADMNSAFNTGYGMGAMNGQSYAQAAMNDYNAFGNATSDPDASTIKATNTTSRTRSSLAKVTSRSKSKSTRKNRAEGLFGPSLFRPRVPRFTAPRYNASYKEAAMSDTITLSAGALALLKLHLERKGDIAVDDATRAVPRAGAGRTDGCRSFIHTRTRGVLQVHGRRVAVRLRSV